MMFFASLKMMLLVSLAMMRCLPQMWRSHASLGEAVIIGKAKFICRRQTSFKKGTFVYQTKVPFLLCFLTLIDAISFFAKNRTAFAKALS